MKKVKNSGYKAPKKGKYCPKCKNKVGCAFHACPHCAYAFVSVKTTRVIQKPSKFSLDSALEKVLELSKMGLNFEQIGQLIKIFS